MIWRSSAISATASASCISASSSRSPAPRLCTPIRACPTRKRCSRRSRAPRARARRSASFFGATSRARSTRRPAALFGRAAGWLRMSAHKPPRLCERCVPRIGRPATSPIQEIPRTVSMLVIHLPTRHSTIRRPCSARRFIEQPDRSERYRILLDVMREDGLEVHDEGYVAFLQTVHERWSANPGYGPEVIPKRAPDAPDAPQTHRAPRRARLVFELHILPHRGGDLAVRSCQRTIRGPCGRQALEVRDVRSTRSAVPRAIMPIRT